MIKLLRKGLADLKIRGGPDDGKPANEVIARKIQEFASEKKQRFSARLSVRPYLPSFWQMWDSDRRDACPYLRLSFSYVSC
jgi:hypothetical protein